MTSKCYVLLGDVVLSRKIPDREAFQVRLQRACVKASNQFQATLHAKAKLLKGTDEIGAVLNSLADTFSLISLILDEIHPYRIRFSLVRDVIDVGDETGDVAKMDGPAFHRASAIIHELKQNGLLFRMATGDTLTDMSISNQVSLLLLLRQRWAAKHHQVVVAYRENETQKHIAEKINVAQQQVSRLLKQINWKQYHIMEESIHKQLALIENGDNKCHLVKKQYLR